MPRNARLTDAVRGRGKALAFLGAAAALTGIGTAGAANAATTPAAAQPTALSHPAAVPFRPASTSSNQSDWLTAAMDSSHHTATTAVKHSAHAVARPHTDAVAKPARHAAKPARHAAKPARHAAKHKRHVVVKHAPAKPWLIYDSVTPSQIPSGHQIATYATGGYAVPASQMAGKHVMWIDTNGSDPRANALDVEPGDATPAMAATWAAQHVADHTHTHAVIYTMRSEWPATQAAVNSLPAHVRNQVRWWIADPTGTPHIVPGSSATQWYWGQNYDITTAAPGF